MKVLGRTKFLNLVALMYITLLMVLKVVLCDLLRYRGTKIAVGQKLSLNQTRYGLAGVQGITG